MNVETRTYVVGLLESYQKRSKQIELLHYELSHPVHVSGDEMIGMLTFARGDSDGSARPGGHVSDKTLYIALNYQNQVNRVNADSVTEVAELLVNLEREQRRLIYYVSLLDKRQSEILELLYFEGYTQEESAQQLGITTRTVRRIKDSAILKLTEFYCFAGELSSGVRPKTFL